MKAHIGVDVKTGLTKNFGTTAVNEKDLDQAGHLLHGEEETIPADSGYRGALNRDKLEVVEAELHTGKIPSKIKKLKKYPSLNKVPLSPNYLKASIGAEVVHPFRTIKSQLGFTKFRYRSLI